MKYLVITFLCISAFFAYVSNRKSEFHYERSGLIRASAQKIFPYLASFKKGGEWNPYDRRDPNLKKIFKGPEGVVGSIMEFDGNSDAGAGSLELLNSVPDHQVQIRLIMTRPLAASNLITYTLTPEGDQTRFSWEMSGDGGFMGKLIGVFIDCEKMVTADFEEGIQNLKRVVETRV